MGCKVIKVTNIPIQVTKDILYTMFQCIGTIEDIKLYPTIRSMTYLYDSRICFIKFKHSSCAAMAPFLNNTPLIDRAIRVAAFADGEKARIPCEERALEIMVAEKNEDSLCVNWIDGVPPLAFYKTTYKPLGGLPEYPDLPSHYSITTVERIRRTLMVANLDHSVTGETLVDYFSKAGEVKYARLCRRNNDAGLYALVEFVDQKSIVSGLKLNNSEITKGMKIKVYHSVDAILDYPEGVENQSPDEKLNAAFLDKQEFAKKTVSVESEHRESSQSTSDRSSRSRSRIRDTKRSRSREREKSRYQKRKRSHERRRSCARKESKYRERDRSRDRKRSRTRGRYRSHDRKRSESRERYRSHDRERSSSLERGRFSGRKREKHQARDTFHERKRSKSRDRCRPRERQRLKSR